MTNDHIINKCIILSPGYSSSYTLATNWFAWGSHHPGKHKQNQKCWRTYGIHTTLCIKMSEVKCKILLSMEIIMSYFRTLGEAAGFLLPPLISKFFSESWRPKKDGQILVNLVEKQSGKQKNNASILFMKDKDQQPTETHCVPSWPKICTFRDKAPSASQFAITDFKQAICSLAIKTKTARLEISRDTREVHHSDWSAKKAFSVNKECGNDWENPDSLSSCVRDCQWNHKQLWDTSGFLQWSGDNTHPLLAEENVY